MEVPLTPIFACSGCHKKFYITGFKINRLGIRNRTCLECAARRRRPRIEPLAKLTPEPLAKLTPEPLTKLTPELVSDEALEL